MTVEWLPDAYCTVEYADSVNEGLAEWEALNTEEKEKALQFGALYINNRYICNYAPDGDAPIPVQTANALLGGYNALAPIYPSPRAPEGSDGSAGAVTSVSISGDGASFSESYDVGYNLSKTDKYPDVTAIISQNGVCRYNSGNTHQLLRG